MNNFTESIVHDVANLRGMSPGLKTAENIASGSGADFSGASITGFCGAGESSAGFSGEGVSSAGFSDADGSNAGGSSLGFCGAGGSSAGFSGADGNNAGGSSVGFSSAGGSSAGFSGAGGSSAGFSGADGSSGGSSGAGENAACGDNAGGSDGSESGAGTSGAAESATKKSGSGAKKRSFRSIAESCMVLENGLLICHIDESVACGYRQKAQRLDCGNFIRHLRSEHSELARTRGLFISEDEPHHSEPKRRRVSKVSVAIDPQTVVESVIRMTCIDHIPISKIESKGFKMIMDPICHSLDMKLNSENVVSHLNICSEHIKSKIRAEVNGKLVSLKIDSASRYGRHILGINVQFWDGQQVIIRTLGKYV